VNHRCLYAAVLGVVLSQQLVLGPVWSADPAAIEKAARQALGREMWRGYGLPDGKLGCAAALSNVLKQAGITRVGSPLVTVLRRQLIAKSSSAKGASDFSEIIVRNGEGSEISNEVLLKDCKAGDILLAFISPPKNLNGGTSAHCGIMGKYSGGSFPVYTNNYMDGIWTEIDIHQMFDCYPYVRLLRLRVK
jgi:hypothetical protein